MRLAAHYSVVDDAAGWAEGYVPDFASELIERGFDRVGWIAMTNGSHREVSAVLTTPDRLALAFPLWVFGSPQLSLKTLLEDGTVVDTASKPSRFIMPLFRGKVHHPRAGHWVQPLASLSIDTALAKHNALVRGLCERRHTRVRSHNDIRLAAVVQNRLARVRAIRLLVSLALTVVPTMAIAPLLPWIFPEWLGLIVGALLSLLLLLWWSPYLARQLPLPRRRSAVELAGPAQDRETPGRLLQ